MSIRYQCDECGSVLKVKDELAGTAGKCPKCKKKFVVPQPDATATSAAEKPAPAKKKTAQPAESKEKQATAAPKKPAPKSEAAKPAAKKKQDDDDFDVDAFLMADGPISSSPPPASGPSTAGGSGGASRSGRKRIVPPTPGEDPLEDNVQTQHGDTDASANARDLLSKNMDDARVRASSIPEEKKKEPLLDLSGVREEAKQAAPYIIGGIVFIIGIFWLSNAMFGTRLKLPPLARVSGTVSVGGEPMPNVMVNLTPVDRKIEVNGKEMRPRTAVGVTDEDGYFTLQYQEGVKGAYIGKARIWVEPLNPMDMKKIPPRYLSISSNDIREVREAGNDGKFNLEFE